MTSRNSQAAPATQAAFSTSQLINLKFDQLANKVFAELTNAHNSLQLFQALDEALAESLALAGGELVRSTSASQLSARNSLLLRATNRAVGAVQESSSRVSASASSSASSSSSSSTDTIHSDITQTSPASTTTTDDAFHTPSGVSITPPPPPALRKPLPVQSTSLGFNSHRSSLHFSPGCAISGTRDSPPNGHLTPTRGQHRRAANVAASAEPPQQQQQHLALVKSKTTADAHQRLQQRHAPRPLSFQAHPQWPQNPLSRSLTADDAAKCAQAPQLQKQQQRRVKTAGSHAPYSSLRAAHTASFDDDDDDGFNCGLVAPATPRQPLSLPQSRVGGARAATSMASQGRGERRHLTARHSSDMDARTFSSDDDDDDDDDDVDDDCDDDCEQDGPRRFSMSETKTFWERLANNSASNANHAPAPTNKQPVARRAKSLASY